MQHSWLVRIDAFSELGHIKSSPEGVQAPSGAKGCHPVHLQPLSGTQQNFPGKGRQCRVAVTPAATLQHWNILPAGRTRHQQLDVAISILQGQLHQLNLGRAAGLAPPWLPGWGWPCHREGQVLLTQAALELRPASDKHVWWAQPGGQGLAPMPLHAHGDTGLVTGARLCTGLPVTAGADCSLCPFTKVVSIQYHCSLCE